MWMGLLVLGGILVTTPSGFAASSLSDTELDAVGAMGEIEGVQESPHSPAQLSDPKLQDLEASGIVREIWPFQFIFPEPVHTTPIPGAFPSARRSHIIENSKRRYPDLFPDFRNPNPIIRPSPPNAIPGVTR